MTRLDWWRGAKGLLVVGGLVVGCGGKGHEEAPGAETPPTGEPQEGEPPERPTPGRGPASNVLPELGWSSRESTPVGRRGVAAVVDSEADRLIVLGKGSDVWSLPLSGPNELQWLRLRPEGELPPATATVAVYDPVGHRALMLFDNSEGDDLAQLWELSLDGTARFSRLTPAGKAPGEELAEAQLAIDVDGNRLFALGGGFVKFGVWTLPLEPGAAWQRLADAPPDRGSKSFLREAGGQLLAFDAPRQRLVAFGLQEVWALSLETGQWSSLGRDPCASSSRYFSAGVFDPLAERVIFVGGECGEVGTFALGDDSWEQSRDRDPQELLSSPAAGAFDAARERFVYAFSEISNSTWQMSSRSLELEALTPNTHTSPSEGSRMVWDPAREAVVSFGGSYDVPTSLRTLDPTATWQELGPRTVFTGSQPGAVYDPTSGAIVSFGSSKIEADDVTVRTLGSQASLWSTLDVAPRPMGRANQVTVYDPTGRRMLIHGGVHNPLYTDSRLALDDTWALSLEGEPVWTQLTPRGPAPRPRAFFRMGAYDVAGERLVVCSVDEARGAIPELHALSLDDDPTWSRLEPTGTPPERLRGDPIYDSLGQRLIFVMSSAGAGTVVSALELGDEPAWHTFCSLGAPPARVYSAPQVVVVPDGLFVNANGEAFRFDLATPYCD